MQTANLEVTRELSVVVQESNVDGCNVGVLIFAIEEPNDAMAQITASDEVKEIGRNGEVYTCSSDMRVTAEFIRYVDMAPFDDLAAVGVKMDLLIVHDLNVRGTASEDIVGLLIGGDSQR